MALRRRQRRHYQHFNTSASRLNRPSTYLRPVSSPSPGGRQGEGPLPAAVSVSSGLSWKRAGRKLNSNVRPVREYQALCIQ